MVIFVPFKVSCLGKLYPVSQQNNYFKNIIYMYKKKNNYLKFS